MPRKVEFDFTGAPPSQGGRADYVPPGRYPVRLADIKDGSSSKGSRMITAEFEVAQGPEQGKRLIEYFAFGSEKKVGEKRLHAYFLAIGLPVGEKKFVLDLDTLIGKGCYADVRDDNQPARGEYEARTVSRIAGFHSAAATNGATPQAAPVAAQPAAVAVAEPVGAVALAEASAEDISAVAADIDDLFN